jgi:protein HOOK1
MPVLNDMFEMDDTVELSKLLQLVLGVAVNCERKSEFIKNIMEMNMDEQHMIMTAIQDLMSKDRAPKQVPNSHDDLGYQLKRLQAELVRVNEQKDEITQKFHNLESQVALNDMGQRTISRYDRQSKRRHSVKITTNVGN